MFLDIVLNNLKNSVQSKKAYFDGKRTYSYGELYKYICNLYKFINSQNLENKNIVIYGEKQIYMKACFLACSFAGYTYIPIDKSTPKERVINIINQINPSLIIGDFSYDGINCISSSKIREIMESDCKEKIKEIRLKPDDIYYIIFTSGSTGIPKGVMVSYENVDSCMNWLNTVVSLKNDVILNQANFSFDLSVADLYLSVINGNSQYVIDINKNFDFKRICNSVKKSDATCAVVTPSFINLLLMDSEFNSNTLPNLKTVIFCRRKITKKYCYKINFKI